jgi:hypothetical protein
LVVATVAVERVAVVAGFAEDDAVPAGRRTGAILGAVRRELTARSAPFVDARFASLRALDYAVAARRLSAAARLSRTLETQLELARRIAAVTRFQRSIITLLWEGDDAVPTLVEGDADLWLTGSGWLAHVPRFY